MLSAHVRSRRHHRRAAAIVEMAMVLPVFMLVTMGIIEFGRALWVANMVTNASREGTRMAILDGSSNAQVISAVRDFLESSLSVSGSDIDIDITITAAEGNPNPGNECVAANTRDLIEVKVAIPFNKVSLVPGNYLEDKLIVGRSAMRHE
ncbi:pilus assembly protein [bacterium]|nr:pilus assembly protein [bacterium]